MEKEAKTSMDYLVACLALMLVLLTAHLVHKLHSDFVSESGAIILLGLVVGGVCKLVDTLANGGEPYLTYMIRFNHETFLNIILPLIIFEAGYSIKHTGVMRNLGGVLLFAVAGTIISTVIIGVIVYYWSSVALPDLYDLNATGAGYHDGSGMFLALTFGALLSATDPVSVIALLGSRFDMSREPPLLYNLIFGESVLNDAVSIVLFEAFKRYIGKEADATSMVLAALGFVEIFVVSSALGYVFGLLAAVFFKYVSLAEIPHLEVSMVMLFAASSYYLADLLSMSGIMSVFVTARIIGHHASYNMSRVSRETAPFVFKSLAALAESAVFFLLGTALWAYWVPWSPYMCFVTVTACLVSRAFVVFPLAALSNLTRDVERITGKMQAFMWYSGLRGAIAFGLVVVLRGSAQDGSPMARVCDTLLTCVLCVVLFTVLFMGSGAAKLLSVLGLDKQDDEECAALLVSRRSRMRSAIDATPSSPGADGKPTTCYGWVRHFERKFIERNVRRKKVLGPLNSTRSVANASASLRMSAASPPDAHSRGTQPAASPALQPTLSPSYQVAVRSDSGAFPASPDSQCDPVSVSPGDAMSGLADGGLSVPASPGFAGALDAPPTTLRAQSAGPGGLRPSSPSYGAIGPRSQSHMLRTAAIRRSVGLYSDAGYDQDTDEDDDDANEALTRPRRTYEYTRLF